MPRKIAVSTLNASTIDILNTIRANASAQYQDQVPEVTTNYDVRQVGDVFFGYPNLANEFLGALVNQIALVRIRSATFNNPYRMFKRDFLKLARRSRKCSCRSRKRVTSPLRRLLPVNSSARSRTFVPRSISSTGRYSIRSRFSGKTSVRRSPRFPALRA